MLWGRKIIEPHYEPNDLSVDFKFIRTSDGSPDLGGGRLPHLQGGLLTVPGCVWRADQVGGVFQRALSKTTTHTCGEVKERDTKARKNAHSLLLSLDL